MQTELKNRSCVHCNISFKMAKDLKTHMLQHHGKKPHISSQCGYSCTKASKLKQHMLVHNGEKPVKCATIPAHKMVA